MRMYYDNPDAMMASTIRLVKVYHENQLDKAGAPYIEHLQIVAETPGFTYDESIVGWLHDIVEDTNMSFAVLRQLGYPPSIVTAIEAITKKQNERYADYLKRVGDNALATSVKLADLRHNMDMTRFRDILTDKDIERLRKYQKAYLCLSAIQKGRRNLSCPSLSE